MADYDAVHAVPKPPPRKRPHGDNIPAAVKRTVDLRDHGICQMPGCGRPGSHHHHVDNRGIGGSSNPERHNPKRIVLLCWWCHLYVVTEYLAWRQWWVQQANLCSLGELNRPLRTGWPAEAADIIGKWCGV